jgi:uncharacterized damage-inducible protein DinB
MTLERLLKDYTAYNRWANEAFAAWLRAKPEECLTAIVPSSFPSLRDTLLHLWGAEKLWLERLRQEEPAPFLPTVFSGSAQQIFEGWPATSAALAEYVAEQPAEFFEQVCTFRLFNGQLDSRPRHQMILHCVQHSTYHRGQLVTMGRSLGLTDPPSTDYIRYVREVNAR